MFITAGVLPDLDYLSYFGGAGAFLRFHRTLLHALPGAFVFSCAVAASFCMLDRTWKPPAPKEAQNQPLKFGTALAICMIGAAGHLFLDLPTGEGLQLFWPFRVHWTAWSLAANFDPWVLVILIAGLLLPQLFQLVHEEIGSRKKPATGSTAAVTALFLLAMYLGARAELHGRALGILLASEYHGREPLAAGAFPSSANPLAWRGVVSTDSTVEEIGISLAPGADFNSDRSPTHYKPESSAALDAAQHAPAVQAFLRYAQFPLAAITRQEDGYRFELRDVRFAAGDNTPANMTVRVDLDSSLRITSQAILYALSSNP